MSLDLIMWAGEDNYTVSGFIKEARMQGVSKRIPKNAIPEGIAFAHSRLFIKHRRAIIDCEDWEVFVQELIGHGYLHLPIQVYSKDIMLYAVMAMEDMHDKNRVLWNEYIEAFNITWHPGVIGYAYITGIQYVVKENEEGLPEEYAYLEGYVEPVRDIHEEGEE